MPIPHSPALFIACAAGLVAKRESRGERRTRLDPGADDAASATFIHHAGFHAHLDHQRGDSTWPLPPATTAMELALVAARAGALRAAPAPGDIALTWSAQRAGFVHAAIVVHVDRRDDALLPLGAVQCRVLDPGANSSRARVTVFNPELGDRFLRWVGMDPPRAHLA